MRRLIIGAVATLAGLTVWKEMRKPQRERDWHGTVAGFVPYDFRKPSLHRLRETYWDPKNPKLITDRVFGIGWGVNFAALWHQFAPSHN